MALIKCPECAREISDVAEACPQCGFPVSIHLEKMKAEKLKAEEIEAKRLEDEKLKLYQKKLVEEHDTLSVIDEPDDYYKSKLNYKLLLAVIGALVLFAIYGYYSNANNIKAKEQQEVSQKRNWFNSAKELIKSNQLKDDELDKAKASLESVTADMTEYKEAQELLPVVTKRISDVEKAREVKAEKERKATEEAQYTPGGKRVHAKHPEWDANDCNMIAKRQIHLGMTKAQVAAAWGRPYTVNKTTGSYGTHEQWVMHEMGSSYVYFEDGICTTIQN